MAYGSKKTSDGKEINADDSRIIPIVGIVLDCTVKGVFELNEDKTVASITFIQANGAEVSHKEWASDDEASQDDTNRRVKHICTKFIGQEAYNNIPEATDFESFFEGINKAIEEKTEGKFRMLFHYNNKGYVTVPRYPNFIESMDAEPSKIVITKYVSDRFVKPAAPQPDAELAGVSGDDDLPF